MGPDLTRSGFLYPPEWLFTWIRNPQKIRPRTKMPNIGLDEREAMAVATYLANLEEDLDKDAREEMRPYLEKPGDPQRGKALFFDPEGKANCSKCHSIHGKGGKVGPSLSLIGSSRTLPFILESILNPKAVITIGYSSVMILTKRGKFLTGIKKNEDENSLDLVNKEGKLLHVRKNNIKKFKTQKISMMPGNFKDILSVEEIRDILAFLATLKIPFENGVVAMNENWEKE